MVRLFLMVSLLVAGCEKPSTSTASEAKAEAVSTEQVEEAVEKAAPAPKVVEVKRAKFEPGDFEGHLPVERILSSFAFEDSNGLNAVFYTLTESSSKPAGAYEAAYTTAVLEVFHLVSNAGEIRVIRTYREVVKECEFDLIIQPHVGNWSVTDVDQDGVGEATIAYTADCTSDVSPLNHKVLITEGGDKFGLRGSTRVRPGLGTETIGGEFTADSMDPRFLEHATSVWNKTIVPHEN